MPTERSKIKRGEVYLGDPGPVVGHEQGGRRPMLVVSIDPMNQSPSRLVIAVPLTTTDHGGKLHVRVEPPEGGLDRISYAMPEMVRSMSMERFGGRLGRVSPDTIETVAMRLGVPIGLGRTR